MKTCLKCGKTYIVRNGELRYFCGRKCYNEYYGIIKQKKYNAEELTKVLDSIECRKCNNIFIPKHCLQILCKNCSGYKSKPKKYTEKICKVCHKKFITNVRNQLYCSKDCADIILQQNIQKNIKLSDYKIFERDNFRCAYCGKTSYEDNVKLNVEHIYPRNKGGINELFNLITACSKCNVGKTDHVLNTDLILSIWEITSKRNEETELNYEELKSIFDKKWKINK